MGAPYYKEEGLNSKDVAEKSCQAKEQEIWDQGAKAYGCQKGIRNRNGHQPLGEGDAKRSWYSVPSIASPGYQRFIKNDCKAHRALL